MTVALFGIQEPNFHNYPWPQTAIKPLYGILQTWPLCYVICWLKNYRNQIIRSTIAKEHLWQITCCTWSNWPLMLMQSCDCCTLWHSRTQFSQSIRYLYFYSYIIKYSLLIKILVFWEFCICMKELVDQCLTTVAMFLDLSQTSPVSYCICSEQINKHIRLSKTSLFNEKFNFTIIARSSLKLQNLDTSS